MLTNLLTLNYALLFPFYAARWLR